MNLDKQFKEILYNIVKKEEVKEFLEFLKETQTDGMGSNFEYKIINIQDIPNIIKEYGNTGFVNIEVHKNIYIEDKIYNPIIFWLFDCGEHLNIYDLPSLKHDVIEYAWLNEEQRKDFIDKFSIPTLEEEIEKRYHKLHPEVRKALMEEVIEFWDEFKDDIRVENDFLESISHNMMLVDAIWNCGSLFCNSTIEHWIEKIYNKKVRI